MKPAVAGMSSSSEHGRRSSWRKREKMALLKTPDSPYAYSPHRGTSVDEEDANGKDGVPDELSRMFAETTRFPKRPMDEGSSSVAVEDRTDTQRTQNVTLTGDALQFSPSYIGKSARRPSSKKSGSWGTSQKSFGFDAQVNDSYQDDDEDLTAWPVTANTNSTSTPTPKHRKSKSISIPASSSSSSVGGTSTVSLGVGRFRLGGRKQHTLRDFGSADAAEESIGSSSQSHIVPSSASMTTTPEQHHAHSFLRKDFIRKTPTGQPTKRATTWTTGRVGELPHKPSSVIVQGDEGPSTVGRKPRNGKVSRLASLFSSRAVIKNGNPNNGNTGRESPFPKPSRGRSMTEDGPPAGIDRTEVKQLFPTNSMPDEYVMKEVNEKYSMPIHPSESAAPKALRRQQQQQPQQQSQQQQRQQGRPTYSQEDIFQRRSLPPQTRTGVPPSPSRSSASGASSGYIGWPGTQDKRGATVEIQPSYDESDEGIQQQQQTSNESTLQHKWLHQNNDTVLRNQTSPGNPSSEDYPSRRHNNEDHGTTDRSVPRRLTPMEKRLDEHTGPIDVDEYSFGDDDESSEEENPADFHLAAAISNATAAASSPLAVKTTIDPRHFMPVPYRASQKSSPNNWSRQSAASPMSLGPSPMPSPTGKSPDTAPVHMMAIHSPLSDGMAGSPRIWETAHRRQDQHTNPAAEDNHHQQQQIQHTRSNVSNGGISIHNLFGPNGSAQQDDTLDEFRNDKRRREKQHAFGGRNVNVRGKDPWDIDNSSAPPSSPGATSVSHDEESSSAFMSESKREGRNDLIVPGLDLSGSENRVRSAGRDIIHGPNGTVLSPSSAASTCGSPEPQPPTEAALAAKNFASPSPRPLNGSGVAGYRHFLDKTKDVPNLMDDLESMSTSTRATSTISALTGPNSPRRQPDHYLDTQTNHNHRASPTSDVFDGISNIPPPPAFHPAPNKESYPAGNVSAARAAAARVLQQRRIQKQKIPSKNDRAVPSSAMNVVHFNKHLATVQTTPEDFGKRRTAHDFDSNLTDTDMDEHGYSRVPSPEEMAVAGRRRGRQSVPEIDLSEPHTMEDYGHLDLKGSSSFDSHGRRNSGFEDSLNRAADQHIETASSSSYASDLDEEEGDEYWNPLSVYYVQPHSVKKLVRKYRKMCRDYVAFDTAAAAEAEEDAKKAFALFEMRSRIMEKDIERGLERQGGTVAVDDLVITPYNQAAHRVRDAVIVSKAWRDGASPRDVITASLLTRRDSKSHTIRRPIRGTHARAGSVISAFGDSFGSIGVQHPFSAAGNSFDGPKFYLEEVRWVDDTDFMQLRCPSLGPRCMRGFEMFTIGDCQSILLKLTNERCVQLREELNEATSCQIEAEEWMKNEAETGFDAMAADDSMMTDAEMTYLTAMEEVKTISKQLVVAEKAFQLVRDRIEKLVAKYESLLVKLETESIGSGSARSFNSDSDSDFDSLYDSEEEDREKEILARRAQKAELKAEVAAREAMLAKQEAIKIREEKQAELEELQQRLADLQSETRSGVDYEHSSKIVKSFTSPNGARGGIGRSNGADGGSPLNRVHGGKNDQDKIQSVKQKFRDRMAERMNKGPPTSRRNNGSDAGSGTSAAFTSPTGFDPSLGGRAKRSATLSGRPPRDVNHNRHRLTGEEMFQHLDFYERSLNSVK